MDQTKAVKEIFKFFAENRVSAGEALDIFMSALVTIFCGATIDGSPSDEKDTLEFIDGFAHTMKEAARRFFKEKRTNTN